MTTQAALSLAPPRVITTGHNPAGTSVFEAEAAVPLFRPLGPAGPGFGRFHSRLVVPVSNTTSPPDLSKTIPRAPPNGVIFCSTDIAPGAKVPMHRTLSVDYIVVLEGEIVLLLDGGEEKAVRKGELIVQRGVNHSWENRGTEICRMIVVMVGAEKVVLGDGTVLEETVIKR